MSPSEQNLAFMMPPTVLVPVENGQSYPVRRVFCVGRNYADHAIEMGSDPDREPPFFFTAWAEAVVGSGATIVYPQATRDYQFEIELVVAIGRSGRNIAPQEAIDFIFGYGVGLDMTRRDLQALAKKSGRPWDIGKNVEQSKPLGTLVPASDFDPSQGSIRLDVNGVTRQSGDLADQIWPVADVVAHLSGLYQLQPGDLIYTGTPAGVGPVRPGDRLAASIAGLPELHITIGEPV
jgi:fumarylpyruvate hydrolase